MHLHPQICNRRECGVSRAGPFRAARPPLVLSLALQSRAKDRIMTDQTATTPEVTPAGLLDDWMPRRELAGISGVSADTLKRWRPHG